jgi:hypothetical protein
MILDFYISIGLIVLLSCLFQIKNFNKIFYVKSWFNKYIQIVKKKPTIIDFRSKNDFDLFHRLNALLIFDFFYISGLTITKFWQISILFLIFSLISNIIIYRLKYNLFAKFLMFLVFLSKLILILYVIISNFFIVLF